MTSVLARVLLVGVAVLLVFVAGQEEGATTSSAAASSSSGPALAASNAPLLEEVCVEGALAQQELPAGWAFVSSMFRACFPNEGGRVDGTVEFKTTFRGVEGCEAVSTYTLTLSGSSSPADPPNPASLAGTYDGRARLDVVSGECQGAAGGVTELPGGSWDGTIEGGRLRIAMHTEGQPDFILEGAMPAGDTESQPEEDAGDAEQAGPTTDPLSAALAELFAGGGDYVARSNEYARGRMVESVYASSDVEFKDKVIGAFRESIGSPSSPTDSQVHAEVALQVVAIYASAKDSNGKLLFPSVFEALPLFGRLAQKAADENDERALALGRFFLLLMELDMQAGKGQ